MRMMKAAVTVQEHTSGGIQWCTFASLDGNSELVHAVSTRRGGVSSGPYTSLNLSATSGDDPQAVQENQRRLCAAVGVAPESLVSPRQVHGTTIRRVGRRERNTVLPDCDGLITNEPRVSLLLRFADCVPLLLYDPRQRAIGLAHAGWRGTVSSMASRLVESMVAAFGSEPAELLAVVGPAIGPCCYEVGPDVVSAVVAAFGAASGLISSVPKRCPSQVEELSALSASSAPFASYGLEDPARASTHFDLWEANRRLLVAAGVQNTDVASVCTACHADLFFSYRAGGGHTGHHGALMALAT